MYRYACWDRETKSIKLFTWNENGERVIYDRPFKPYLYIEDNRGIYKSIFGTKLVKKEFKSPYYRKDFIQMTGIKRIFENLPVDQQFLMDEYEGKNNLPDFTKNPLKICFFDIETAPLPNDEFPEASEAKAEISLITIHNSLNNKYTTFGIKPFTGELPDDLICEYIYCETEAILLEKFLNYLEYDHPDILSAWNSNFFDAPYLVNRITKVLGEKHLKRLSPIGSYYTREAKTKDSPPRYYTEYVTDGMLIIDYIDVYKKFKVKLQESYKLDFIGELEVGYKKLEYKGSIGEFQKNDWNRFVLYNIRDVELLVRIDKKTNYFGIFRYLAYIGLVNFKESLGVVNYVTGGAALVARSHNKKIYTPVREVKEGKNVGAYVSVKPGLIKDLITYDASSLYPSCCITNNVSMETLVGKYEINEEDDNDITITLTNNKKYKLTKEKFDKFINVNNLIKTPAKTIFSQKEQGIYAEFMELILNSRKANRKKLFELEEELKNNKDLSEKDKSDIFFEINRLDILQYAQKLAINSFYGCITSKFASVGSDDLGNTITLTGQDCIKRVNRIVKDFILLKNPNFTEEDAEKHLIFNDTDSAGVSLNGVTDIIICKDGIVTPEGYQLIKELGEYIDKELDNYVRTEYNTNRNILTFKREKICDFGLYRKKKNYILHVIDDEGKVDENTGKLKTKWHYSGIELAKAIMTKEIKELGKKVIEPMIIRQDKDETDKLLRDAFQQFKKLPLSTICKIGRIKTFDKYVKECKLFTPAKGMSLQARAAYNHNLVIKLEKFNFIQPLVQGESVQIIPLIPNNKYKIDCIAFRTGEYPKEFDKLFSPDYKDIFNKPFFACISSLYDIAGWSCREVTDEYIVDIFDIF